MAVLGCLQTSAATGVRFALIPTGHRGGPERAVGSPAPVRRWLSSDELHSIPQHGAGRRLPIHIIVKNGKITLLGVADTESDKTVAGMRARQVPGSFGVENELAVEKSEAKSTEK
jgi:osmotically-inducible protein OsmY